MRHQSKLYALTFHDLARLESELVDLCSPESETLSPVQKKAIVSAIASAILVVDIANECRRVGMVDDRDVGISRYVDGVGGGIKLPPSCVHGCSPHSKKIPQKICANCTHYSSGTCSWHVTQPQSTLGYLPVLADSSCNEFKPVSTPEPVMDYNAFGRRVADMLQFFDEVILSEAEWADSYGLYVKRRKRKPKGSTKRTKS